MPKEITLRFRSDKKLKARLLAVAKKRGGDKYSAIVRQALEQFIPEEEKRLGIEQPAH